MRKNDELTKRQKDALTAINEYTEVHKFSPTVRELSESLGHASSSTTHDMLVQLERKGYILRRVKLPRTIQVIRHTPANPHIGIQ